MSTSLLDSIHVLLRRFFNSGLIGSEDSEEHDDEVEVIWDDVGVVFGSDSVVVVDEDVNVDGDGEDVVIVVVAALVGGTSLNIKTF